MARESLTARVVRLEERDRERATEAAELRAAVTRLEGRVFQLAVAGAGIGSAIGAGAAQFLGGG